MEKKPEEIQTDEWLKEALAAAEAEPEILPYGADEMISCPQCRRASPPTRARCFYCNAELPVSERQIESFKPQLRKLESWEKGFNIIFLSAANSFDLAKIGGISQLTQLEKDDLQKVLENGKPLPVARAESEPEAGVIARKLSELGIKTRILADEDLQIEKFTRRLRRIEFFDDKIELILFNSDERAEIPGRDLTLIVTGAVFERRIEAIEQRKKRENKITETSEINTDELLIDIYTRSDAIGYRVLSSGFDFSGLGPDKGILARENMERLAERLRNFAAGAKFVGDYVDFRDVLGNVWEAEQQKNSRGLQRKSFGRFEIENVTTINNLVQFTKYSRMQWHLL